MRRTAPVGPRALGRRPVLDGLRGIAVLLVMLMHTGVLPGGYMGVDLFFGLSGFLITSLLCEEWERSGSVSLARFYERRARRLLPALVVLLALLALVGVVCWQLTGWPLETKILTTVLFMNNWVAALGHTADLGGLTPTWSLAQEEQFYLVWPLLLMLLLRHRVRPAVIVGLLGAVIVLALLVIAPYVATHVHGYSAYFSPVDRGAELLIGCVGAIVWRQRLIGTALEWLRELARRAAPARARRMSLGRRLSSGFGRSRLPVGRLSAWARVALRWLLAIEFARLVLAQGPPVRSHYLDAVGLGVGAMLLLIDAEGSLLSRLIACGPLRSLGRISYGLYLFHLTIRNVVFNYLPNQPVIVDALITIVASIALATISWRLLESRVLARRTVSPRPRSVVVVRPARGMRWPLGARSPASWLPR